MKLMVLGGGENQKQVFEAAKSMGVDTVLCDYSESAVCIELADVFYKVSILDYEGVIHVARKEDVDGIFTNSEPAVHIAVGVANELGLPSNKLSSIETFLDPVKFREFQRANGFFSTKSIIIENETELENRLCEFKYPIMIKPIGSSASRGVSRVYRYEDALKAVKNAMDYSKIEKIIAEEFVERDHNYVISGDVYVQESEVIYWGIMNSLRDKYGNDNVPTGTSYPSMLSEKRKKIYMTTISKMFKLLDVEFGSFNIEAVFDSDDNLFIIEVNPRNGGNCITKQLKLSTGIDLNIFNIKSALGMKILEEEYSGYRITPSLTYMIHSNEEGFFNRLEVAKEIRENIIDMELEVEKKDKVEAFNSGDKKFGTLMIKLKSIEEMKSIMDSIEDKVRVKLLSITVNDRYKLS